MATSTTSAVKDVLIDDQDRHMYFHLTDWPNRLFIIYLTFEDHKRNISLGFQKHMADMILEAYRTKSLLDVEFEPHETDGNARVVLSVEKSETPEISLWDKIRKFIKPYF